MFLCAATDVIKSLDFKGILLDEVCFVKTSVKGLFSQLSLNSVKVDTYLDSEWYRTNKNNEILSMYEVVLPIDKIYLLDYTANGFYSKHIEIDLRNNSDSHSNGYFALEINLDLIEEQSNFEGESPKSPIARAAFSYDKGSIEWDIPYLEE